MKAVLIPANGSEDVRVVEIEPNLKELQSLVGGHIEYVHIDEYVHGYINEDGKFRGLDPNLRATELVFSRPYFDVILGDMVILGKGEDGTEAQPPKHILDWALGSCDPTLGTLGS